MPIRANELILATASCLLLSATACTSISRGRTGPDFDETFPDPTVLLTTDEPARLREVLRSVPLPQDPAHHQALMSALERVEAFDTDRLLLLTEAVSLPDRVADVTEQGLVPYQRVGNRIVVAESRGVGPFAIVLDQLLLRGAPRITDPSPTNFGRLIAATQDVRTEQRLVDLLLRGDRGGDWDDGSVDDLLQMLAVIGDQEVRAEFCADVLIPAGRLPQNQVYAALTQMVFDSARLRLLRADYARRSSLPVQDLLAHIEAMRFDSARVELARAARTIVERMDAAVAGDVVAVTRSDNSRSGVVDALSGKIALNDAADALRVVRHANFDAGREAMLEHLVGGEFPQIDGDGLVDLVLLAQFDGGRNEILRMLYPRLGAPLTGDQATRLLAGYQLDAGRQQAVTLLGESLTGIPEDQRDRVLATFSYDAARERARDALRWSNGT